MSERDKRLISEMRNLGPVCQADLNAVGIYEAGQLKEIGVEQAFIRMLNGRKKSGRSAKCCNAAYLYALHGAIHDIDWRELLKQRNSSTRHSRPSYGNQASSADQELARLQSINSHCINSQPTHQQTAGRPIDLPNHLDLYRLSPQNLLKRAS